MHSNATAHRRSGAVKGHEKPRIAPPVPVRSDVDGFRQVAADCGYSLMPWQATAGRYLEARGTDRLLYREVAIIVARQNGKTTLLVPLIVKRLLEGRRILHTAQDRVLPREVFGIVAELMWEKHQKLFPPSRGGRRSSRPRFANGQEEVKLSNGGSYSIVAPTPGGARGRTADLVIVDEVREMEDWDFIKAAKPTLTSSRDPQMVYLSNAGSEASTVLNAIRKRRDDDSSLAYLEWSAAPDRKADDPVGWAESNPSIGHETEEMGSIAETLKADLRTALLEGTIGDFETEHLCRWVISMRQRLVEPDKWSECSAQQLDQPNKFALGVSIDPEGKRGAVVQAWRQKDDTFAVRVVAEASGDPFSVEDLGEQLRTLARGAIGVGFGSDDLPLARLVSKPKPETVVGPKFSAASAHFANLVHAGWIKWRDADQVTDDLGWTARKDDGDGTYHAVRSDEGHPIPAALAAIRAVWLASSKKAPVARVM